MSAKVFEYAIIRVVPCVIKEEFINVGVILYSRHLRFLDMRIAINEQKLLALQPDIDIELIASYLESFRQICKGEIHHEPSIASMEPHERFRWLTANRSTIIQTSTLHTGLTEDAALLLSQLFDRYVG